MLEPLHHFYHIYSKGQWEVPVQDHIRALKQYGLYNKLSSLNVGIVGPPETREAVKNYLNSQDIKYNVCTEVDDGWEQETLDELWNFAKNNDGYALYAHTKNAVNINPLHVSWRKSMTYYNVVNWQSCVKLLDNNYCAVGCHYLLIDNKLDERMHGFYAGTYWWTKMKYLKNFPRPARTNRYDAEGWIGFLKPVAEDMGDTYVFHDYTPFHPASGLGFVTEW